MRIEVALGAADGVGEGPFWDEAEQALWWVDIAGRSVQRWQPVTGDHRRWPMPDFPSAVVMREQGGLLLAMRDGLYFMDPVTGALELFCAPDAERPDNRSNEAKCGPTGDFWLGTMDNNLHPDGSPREMTGSTGALYRVLADGSFTREVDGVGLSNTLAWSNGGRTLLFADTLTGVISTFAVREDGSLAIAACSATPSCRASATARRSTAQASCGTRASPVPAWSGSPRTGASTARSTFRSPIRPAAASAVRT